MSNSAPAAENGRERLCLQACGTLATLKAANDSIEQKAEQTAAPAMTEFVESRAGGLGKTAAYLVLVGIFATVTAATVGFLFVAAIAFPLSLALAIAPSLVLSSLWYGVIFATPVTLILLPAVTIVGRRHPLFLYFGLPLVGSIGGILAIGLWSNARYHWPVLASHAKAYLSLDLPPSSSLNALFILAGGLAGWVAGVFFAAAFRESRR